MLLIQNSTQQLLYFQVKFLKDDRVRKVTLQLDSLNLVNIWGRFGPFISTLNRKKLVGFLTITQNLKFALPGNVFSCSSVFSQYGYKFLSYFAQDHRDTDFLYFCFIISQESKHCFFPLLTTQNNSLSLVMKVIGNSPNCSEYFLSRSNSQPEQLSSKHRYISFCVHSIPIFNFANGCSSTWKLNYSTCKPVLPKKKSKLSYKLFYREHFPL